ncbi:hypothetical protein EMCRGX_G005866 [Ephydatia muelleri]
MERSYLVIIILLSLPSVVPALGSTNTSLRVMSQSLSFTTEASVIPFNVTAISTVDNKNGVELQENTAYAGVQKREAVDVKENSAYGMIPKTDTGKVDSTYDTVQSTQA